MLHYTVWWSAKARRSRTTFVIPKVLAPLVRQALRRQTSVKALDSSGWPVSLSCWWSLRKTPLVVLGEIHHCSHSPEGHVRENRSMEMEQPRGRFRQLLTLTQVGYCWREVWL
jgi:hypothetical protein